MSLLRFDPTTSDWVVFSPSRALRPHDGRPRASDEAAAHAPNCPFCPGNEAFTPPEIYGVRPPGERCAVLPAGSGDFVKSRFFL